MVPNRLPEVEPGAVRDIHVDSHPRLPIGTEVPSRFFEHAQARADELKIGAIALAIQDLENEVARSLGWVQHYTPSWSPAGTRSKSPANTRSRRPVRQPRTESRTRGEGEPR